MNFSRSLVFLALVLSVGACGDDVQLAKAPAKSDAPMNHPHGMPTPSSASAPAPVPADPFSDGAAPAIEKAASTANPDEVVVGGTIEIDPAVKLPSKTLFVYLIGSPTERIPLLARRYENPQFPLQFAIRRRDTAMGAATVDKPVYVRAMLSDTGDVMKGRSKTVSEQAFEPYKTSDAKLTLKP